MTLTTTEDKDLLTKLMDLIRRKEAHRKEGEDLKKLTIIYQSEISKMENQMHRTAGGTIMLIQEMDDDHLFNTIKLFLTRSHGDFQRIPKKYMDEAKSRNGMIEKLLGVETVIEQDDPEYFDF